ncbi:MAG: hypothetical protein IH953_00520 [Chloroflexi bacterium]|nr:hypothetical protein [Chloroflexota bacterium]
MTKDTERAQVGWGFWGWWVLASSVGFAVVFFVGRFMGYVGGGAVLGAVFGAVAGAVAGASIGIAQWLVLWRQVSRPGRWVLSSTVGLAATFAVLLAVGEAVGNIGAVFVGGNGARASVGAVAGASIGIAQWLFLRRQVSRPGWWVLSSIVGLAVGFAVGRGKGLAVGEAVGGVVYGAITGGVLVWLLRQPRPEA